MENEQWKPVIGYEGLYEVSDTGRVKSVARTVPRETTGPLSISERILVQSPGKVTVRHPSYRPSVEVWRGNRRKRIQVARLVCLAFIANPDNKPQTNHMDGVSTNNNATNLEWVTAKENNIHARVNHLVSSDNLKKRVKGTHFKTNEVIEFESLTSAAKHFGVTKNAINAGIHGYGRAKRCKGFTWEYLD